MRCAALYTATSVRVGTVLGTHLGLSLSTKTNKNAATSHRQQQQIFGERGHEQKNAATSHRNQQQNFGEQEAADSSLAARPPQNVTQDSCSVAGKGHPYITTNSTPAARG